MKLLNLITVADENITMLLTGIRPDGVRIGYNFIDHRWKDDNKYSSDMLVRVKEFSKSNLYHKLRRCEIKTFSTMNKNHMQAFRGIDTARNTILIIEIFITGQHFDFLKSFEMDRKSKSTVKKSHKRSFSPKSNMNKKEVAAAVRYHEPYSEILKKADGVI